MKNLITIILLLLVVSCQNNSLSKIREARNKIEEVKQNLGNINELTEDILDVQKKNKERLAKLTPITKEQIENWMPEKLGDLKRTAYSIENQKGLRIFKLTFKGEDEKIIKITISDGAGKGATMVSVLSMLQNNSVTSENRKGYERRQTFDGQHTLVKYKSSKKYEKSNLQYLKNGRFGVEAIAWEMKPDQLWNYLKKLELEALTK